MQSLLRVPLNMPRLKTFGCAAYGHIHWPNRFHKFQSHAEEGIFLGMKRVLQLVYVPQSRSQVNTSYASLNEMKSQERGPYLGITRR